MSDFEAPASAPSVSESSTPDVSTPSSAPDVNSNTPSQPTEAAIEKFRIKAGGQDRELSRAEMEKYASMGLSANEKWEEASKMRKSQEAWLKQLHTDPYALLSNPNSGIDFDSIAMQHLSKQVDAELARQAEASMSPEERQAKVDAKELEEYRATKRQSQEQQSKAQAEQANREFEQTTTNDIKAGFAEHGIPHTKFTWDTTLQYMAQAMDAGHSDVTPADVLHLVKRDYQASFDGLFDGEDEEVLSRFSPEKIAKIQAAVIKQAKGGKYQAKPATAEPEPKQSHAEYLEEIKQKIRNGEI